MNLQNLDQTLRQTTEHELEYKNGKQNKYRNNFKTTNINGQEVLYISLRDMIQYQNGAFISVKKHSRFQTFPLHCHDDIEINYMYSGTCRQIINGKTYSLTKGQTLLLNSETIHTIEPLDEDDILININIEKDFLNANFFNRFSSDSILTSFFLDAITDGVAHDNYLIFHSENSERLSLFVSEFLCEWYSPSMVSKDIIESLFTLIITELVNVYKKDLTHSMADIDKNPLIPILRYIEQNYLTCSLKSTAKFFNLNANYLSNLLKKHTGYSYRELIQKQKIKSAQQLLKNTNHNIVEIANILGYENVSFFYKKFQEECNCLPGEFRKRYSWRKS